MNPSTIARFSVANELLRRRNQPEYDNTLRAHRGVGRRAALIIVSFEAIPTTKKRLEQQNKSGGAPARSSDLSTADEEASAEATRFRTSGLDSIAASSVVNRRESSMWRPGLNAGDWNSSIFAALRQQAEGTVRGRLLAADSVGDAKESQYGHENIATLHRNVNQPESGPPHAAFRFPATANDLEHYERCEIERDFDVLPPYSKDLEESVSPTSDTTLCEEPTIYSLSQPKGGDGIQPHLSNHGTGKHVKIDESLPTPVPSRHARHQRELPTDSALITARTPSIPLRARAKTNEGMLQFRANPAKEPSFSYAPHNKHRRKISINLPIHVSTAPPGGAQQVESSHYTLNQTAQAPEVLTQQERELEYKHRHTFIGTAALDDFLEVLEVSPDHTTTKNAVAKAYVILSSNKQLFSRQCSTRPDGWELISRITPDVTNTDYITQLHVRLGSITLRQFLDLIPFDEKEEVGALRIVEGFSAASHMDAKAGVGTGSKARAFRSWMIRQEDIGG